MIRIVTSIMASAESAPRSRQLTFLALLLIQLLSGCNSAVSDTNKPIIDSSGVPTAVLTESNGVLQRQQQMIEQKMGTSLSVISADDHFRLFAVENNIDPELLRIYQQALEVAYQYVTRELGLIFPENQPLLVLIHPPGEYQEHLTIGEITALPKDDSLQPIFPDLPYQCGNLPVFELQLYPVEKIESHQLVGSYIHELIHYYLRAYLGPSATELAKTDSGCQYSFILEEALANLAKVLYYQDQQLNLDEVDLPLLHATGIPLARQDLLAHGSSYGVWGYLASMIGTEQTSSSTKSNLSQLLPVFINRVAAAQASGQPVSWDEELMTLISSDGASQVELTTGMYEWVAKLLSGQPLWGGQEFKQGTQIVLSENAYGESQRHFQCQITRTPFFQQFNLNAMRQGQYAMIEIIKDENVDNWRGVVISMPRNFRLIAYSESSRAVYPDLAIFPTSGDPMVNQIFLPPDTTGVIVWSDNSDTENKPSWLTFSVP